MTAIGLISLWLLGVAVLVWSFCGLRKEADKFYSMMKQFEDRAKQATTRDDLMKVRHETVEFVKKEAWHRNYGAEALRVLAYIDGKLSNFP